MDWWQTLPAKIDPVAFSVGFFSVYWYAVFLLLGIGFAFLFLSWLRRRGELPPILSSQYPDLFFWTLAGAFLGGKVGYILLYAGEFFLEDPLRFLIPYDLAQERWTGLAGMSYHGAALGGILAVILFSRFRQIPLSYSFDLMALVAPVLTFFGRLGNFFTGELYGRITEKPWGMFFSEASPTLALRHPSALYEASLEGLLLFFLLFAARKRLAPGKLALVYILSYSLLRFAVEFVRAPDPQRGLYGGILTLGQILSGLFFLAALLLWKARQKHALPREIKP